MRLAPDPEAPAARSGDPGDDYLLALAQAERAVLVTGDQHLLALAGELPIHTPRAFLDALADLRIGERPREFGEERFRDDELELPGKPTRDDLRRRSASGEE